MVVGRSCPLSIWDLKSGPKAEEEGRIKGGWKSRFMIYSSDSPKWAQMGAWWNWWENLYKVSSDRIKGFKENSASVLLVTRPMHIFYSSSRCWGKEAGIRNDVEQSSSYALPQWNFILSETAWWGGPLVSSDRMFLMLACLWQSAVMCFGEWVQVFVFSYSNMKHSCPMETELDSW